MIKNDHNYSDVSDFNSFDYDKEDDHASIERLKKKIIDLQHKLRD